VVASLRELVMRLGAERPEILEIRLFGSLARGSRNPFADADVLIVLEASDLRTRERIPHYKPSRIPVPMDLTICTRSELARELAAAAAKSRFRATGWSLTYDRLYRARRVSGRPTGYLPPASL
jgi:predicted nucleotidyltransferase